jgi:hypothetical protein
MKTKAIMPIMVVMLTLAILASSVVMAQNNDSVSENSALNEQLDQEFNESSSGSVGWEKVKNWLIFNQEKKAERELKIAKMLLIQARIAEKNNNTEAMEKALDKHNKILDKLDKRMNKMKENSNSNRELEKVIGLERAILVHEARIARLNSLLQNENLTDEQIAKIEEKISKAENVTARLTSLQEARADKLEIKLMAKLNITEQEAQELVKSIQDANNISELREIKKEIKQEIKDQREIRREEIKAKIEQLREEFREKRENRSQEDDESSEEDETED